MASRIGLVILVVLLAAGAVQAAGPRLGGELGIGRSSFAHAGDRRPFEDAGRWLPRAAVVATFELAGRVHLAPMLEYVERGATSRADGPQFSETQSFRERLLALGLQWSRPVLPRLAPTAALEFAYLLEGESRGTYTDPTANPFPYRFDYAAAGDRTELLAKVGLQLEIPVSRLALAVHGRYVHGITERSRPGSYASSLALPWTSPGPSFAMQPSRTRAAEFGVGFRW